MAAVRGGVFPCGSTNTRRAGHLPRLPCIGEIADGSCVFSGSSPARPKASLDADAKPKPVVEASAGKNSKKPLAISATVGRGRRYGPSYGNGSPTHHLPASPSPGIRRGHDHRDRHGGEDASSSVTQGLEKGQVRLPTRANFMKPSTTPQNIILETTRHPSLLDRRGAVSDWRVPKASGKENEVYDQNNWQNDTVSSRISSGSNCGAMFIKSSATPQKIRLQTPRDPSLLDMRVVGSNQVPPKSTHNVVPAIVTHQSHTNNCPQHLGAADAIDERRSHKGSVVTAKCLRQSSSTTSNSSKSALGPLGKVKDKAALVLSASAHHTSGGTVGAGKKEAYITTLGPGGGYGDPHPPPFYKCEVCRKKTAFYRLKCCRLVVCEGCGCSCDPADTAEDEKVQSRRQRGKVVLAGKEKLPKVKLEGSDLFLWQPCSFPARLMLCMAKRSGNHLQYYFAPVDELMNPQVKVIRATVYDFRQHGRDARSLSVRDELLMRKQLC